MFSVFISFSKQFNCIRGNVFYTSSKVTLVFKINLCWVPISECSSNCLGTFTLGIYVSLFIVSAHTVVSMCISYVQFGIFVHWFCSVWYLCALFQLNFISLFSSVLYLCMFSFSSQYFNCAVATHFFISKASLIVIYFSCARYREKVCENDELRSMKGGGRSEEGKQLKILVFSLQFLFHSIHIVPLPFFTPPFFHILFLYL